MNNATYTWNRFLRQRSGDSRLQLRRTFIQHEERSVYIKKCRLSCLNHDASCINRQQFIYLVCTTTRILDYLSTDSMQSKGCQSFLFFIKYHASKCLEINYAMINIMCVHLVAPQMMEQLTLLRCIDCGRLQPASTYPNTVVARSHTGQHSWSCLNRCMLSSTHSHAHAAKPPNPFCLHLVHQNINGIHPLMPKIRFDGLVVIA